MRVNRAGAAGLSAVFRYSSLPLLFIILFGTLSAFAESPPPPRTTVIPVIGSVEDSIDSVRWGIAEAVEEEASSVVLLIDTPGGSIDATRWILQELDRLVEHRDVRLISYIKSDLFGGARSAGAFITFACHDIYMQPTAYIGASQMVVHTEEYGAIPVKDVLPAWGKIEADYMAFFRARAQHRGHPWQVLDAMALEDVVLWAKKLNGSAEFHTGESSPDADSRWENIKPEGKILALTATEMADYGIAQLGAPSELHDVRLTERAYRQAKEQLILEMITPEGWKYKTRRVEVGTPEGVSHREITFFKDTNGIEFVFVPPGQYVRGEGRNKHEVELTNGFWMSKTPVTQEQYESVIGENPSRFQEPDWPVDRVTWHEAVEFTAKLSEREGLNYRLPTEAEWEFAARAGSSTEYFFGDDAAVLNEYAWYRNNSRGETQRVAQKRANALGLYDIYGNVWEWCLDWHGEYREGPLTDPTGPRTGRHRVLRGGSWRNRASSCRSAERLGYSPDVRQNMFGVRVVVEMRDDE